MAGGPIGNMTIKVDLDSTGFNKGMSGLNRQMKMVGSELASNLSVFDKTDKSVEKLRTRYDGLNKMQKIQEQRVKELKDKYDHLSETTGENSAKTQAAAAEYNKANAELNAMTKEVADLGAEIERLESPWTKVGNQLTETGERFQKIGSGMKDVGKSMSMYVTAPLAGLGGMAVKTGVDFTRGMNEVKAISGATGGELDQLKDKARELGAKTKFSASEAAEGFKYMSLAGWDTSDMLDGIDGMMSLAAASGEELGAVSDIVTDGLSAFGLEAGESGRMADVLAAASANANTDVTGLGNAFKYVAPVAGSLGFTMEDTSKAIGLMSNAGIKGEKAGTALRTMMTNLAKPTKAMQGAMDELGVSITDQDGNMKSLDEIMGDLRGSFDGLTEDQQASYAATIFGKEAMSGALAIINASEDEYNNLGEAINNSTGEANRMAKEMEEGLPGALNRLRSTWEETLLQINDVMAPFVEKVVEFIIKIIDKFQGLSDGMKRFIVIAGAVAAAIGPILIAGGTLLMWIGGLMKTLGPVISALSKFSGIAKGLGAVLAAITSPVGLTVLAITGLATAFTIAYKKSETFRNVVNGALNGVKEVVLIVKDAIVEFVQSLFENIKMFWEENGETVLNAFKNIWNAILQAVQFVVPLIQAIFGQLMEFISNIWEGIKGVITGALEVIKGTVNVFAGVFTGDFSRMWEGVKQIFSGAINMIVNLFKITFIGQIITNIIGFVGRFSELIRGLVSKVLSYFKNLAMSAINIITSLVRNAISLANKLREMFSSIINALKNRVVSIFTTLLNGIKNILSNLYNATRSSVNNIRNFFVNGMNVMKNRVVSIISNMKDTALNIFNKIVSGAKAIPGKMRDALVNGKNKVVSGIKSLGNSMASTLGKVVNGVIGGINTVMEKIGISKSLSTWDVPQFSTGTAGQGSPSGKLTRNGQIAMDTLAVVGDRGPGNGKGTRELVHYPNGQVGLYDKDQMIFAPKGTTIFNNKQTEDLLNMLPRFSLGTLARKAWQGAKNVGGKVKSIAGKAIDYISNPSKVFEDLVSAVMPSWDISGFMLHFAKGIWNKTKSVLFDWMKARFDEAGHGKKQPWMSRFPITTPYSPNAPVPGYPRSFNGGKHFGIDWGTSSGTNLTSPVAGTVKYQSDHGGGRVARVDYGKGAMYFLHMNSVKSGKVAIGESLGRSGNTGAYTTGPHVHVQDENPKTSFLQNRNTRDPMKMFKSHAKGGWIKSRGLFNLHDDEYVIPMNNPTNAMKLIAHMSKRLAGKSKQTSQLPDYRNNQDDSLMTRLIETQQEQIELLKSLLMKDTDVYMDGEKLSKDVDRRNLQREKRYDRFKGGVYI